MELGYSEIWQVLWSSACILVLDPILGCTGWVSIMFGLGNEEVEVVPGWKVLVLAVKL